MCWLPCTGWGLGELIWPQSSTADCLCHAWTHLHWGSAPGPSQAPQVASAMLGLTCIRWGLETHSSTSRCLCHVCAHLHFLGAWETGLAPAWRADLAPVKHLKLPLPHLGSPALAGAWGPDVVPAKHLKLRLPCLGSPALAAGGPGVAPAKHLNLPLPCLCSPAWVEGLGSQSGGWWPHARWASQT